MPNSEEATWVLSLFRRYSTMAVQWQSDVEQALIEASQQKKPLLLDFSAAPA
jgi:hypothetical protein